MRKYCCLMVLLALACALPLFANGSGDKGQIADGRENWKSEIDITTRKAGKYNLIITGTDRAENVGIAGPINIYIDPKSDLPVISITNPVPGMRVGGDLNIVGNCVDDDAVAKVEVKIDNQDWIEASGTEYWSYYLDGATLPDGRHTIIVRGIDINGKVSKERSVYFDLDRHKPVSFVDSHAAGALVAGKVKVVGLSQDANFVSELSYSLDQGKSFERLGLKATKAADGKAFSFSLDTGKYPDGPFVVWFKAKDRAQSIGVTPFLLFIDNTKPLVELISPTKEQKVNGDFDVVCRVYDLVGLSELSWKFGSDQNGIVDIKPGNPYFTATLKAPPKGNSLPFIVRAKDTSGNISTLTSKILMDNEADLPVTSIMSPVELAQLSGTVILSGHARDDDGVSTIRYRVDSAAAVDVATSGAYRVEIPGLGVGKHSLSVSAVDIHGREGPQVKVNLVQTGSAPRLDFVSLLSQGPDKKQIATDFRAGIEAAPDSSAQVSGLIRSDAKIASLSYQIGDAAAVKLNPAKAFGEVPFAFPLPNAGPYGLLRVQVDMADEFGRSSSISSFVYITDYSMIRREPEFDFADERLAQDGKVLLGMEKPFLLCFVGETIAAAELIPASDIVALEFEGSILRVKALKEGTSKALKIQVRTNKKHSFSSREFTFLTDNRAPALSLDAPSQGSLFAKAFSVRGSASDGTGVASISWKLWPSGDSKPLSLKGSAYEFSPDFASLPEGANLIAVEAADSSGNLSRAFVSLVKDVTAPRILSLSPVEAEDMDILVAGQALDASGVSSVEFAADGKSFESLSTEAFFSHSYNPIQSPAAKYRLTDKIGNQAVVESPHFLNPAPMPMPPKGPSIAILFPAPNSNVAGEIFVLVKIASASPLSAISWACDVQKGSLDPATGPVHLVRISTQGMKGKNATVTIHATDSAKGSNKAQVAVAINPSALAPQLEILSPAEAEASALPLVSLRALSDYGVESTSYSLDSGPFIDSSSAGSLSALLSALPPGMHSLSVKARGLNALESPVLKRSFKVIGTKPLLGFSFLTGKDSVQEYQPGMALVVNGTRLVGTISAANGLAAVSANLAGSEVKISPKKISATESSFELALPPGLAYERNQIVVSVQDSLGLSSVESLYFHRVSPQAASDQEEGIRVVDSKLLTEGSPHSLRLTGKSLSARFVGRPIASVSFNPDIGAVASISNEGRLLMVSPGAAEGISKPTKFSVKTVDGDVFEWGPVVLIVDSAPPAIDIQSPLEDQWLRDKLDIELTATDPNGIENLGWSLDGTTWTDIPVPASGPARLQLPLTDLPDGSLTLAIRARDRSGATATALRTFNKDTQLPSGMVLAPRLEDTVNGYITIAAGFADANGSLEKLEFSTDGKTWAPLERFYAGSRDLELSTVENDVARIQFKATDKSGNSLIATPLGKVDGKTDLPTVIIQLPQEMEVLRADFEISGVVTDDDGVAAIYYSIDRAPIVKLDMTGQYSFAIPIRLLDTTDNEHNVEIQAEDIFGVKGEKILRRYRISKEEPIATMSNPPIEQTVKGIITVQGTSSDANGISRVSLSVDNSLSFNLCDGDVDWKYRMDTRVLADGMHSLYVKPVDKYEIEGFFATLINIDNTPPEITLDQPTDGSEVSGTLNTSGRVYDSLAIKSIKLEFHRIMTPGLATATGGKTSMELDLGLEQIITRSYDISDLEEGVYNLRIRVIDRADNQALATRTVTVVRKKKTDSIDLMFPLKGETISGEFSIHGTVRTEKATPGATLYLDGKELSSVEIDENGFFSYAVNPAELEEGDHVLSARIISEAGETISAPSVPITYKRNGPWISIDTFQYGRYLPNRPYMRGRVGWYDDSLDAQDKKTKARLKGERVVNQVDISFDNGKNFEPVSGASKWHYRLQTQDYREGALYLIMRATYADGTKAYAKTVFNLDKTAPKLMLLAPQENERLNEKISLFGTASDETKLGEIKVQLRPGDKAGYAVPSFIQGLFFDAHVLGSTIYEIGGGLTFFDNNVKLMGFYGQGSQDAGERFGGSAYGAKLLANIYYFPFSYAFGPDWEFLSANLAVGTVFTYFDMKHDDGMPNAKPPITLASILAQVEFPIFNIPKWTVLRRYSAYSEFQVWLISSDIEGGLYYKMSFGARANVF